MLYWFSIEKVSKIRLPILKDSLALKDTTYFEGLTIWSCFPRIFYLFPFIDDLPIKNDIIVQVSLLQNIMKPLQSCHFCAKHKNSLAVRLPFPSCQFTDSTLGWKVDKIWKNNVFLFFCEINDNYLLVRYLREFARKVDNFSTYVKSILESLKVQKMPFLKF